MREIGWGEEKVEEVQSAPPGKKQYTIYITLPDGKNLLDRHCTNLTKEANAITYNAANGSFRIVSFYTITQISIKPESE